MGQRIPEKEIANFKFVELLTDDTRKIVLEQVTGRWSYNRRPAIFGVYIIYEYGKNLEDVLVYINQNIF